MSRKHFSSGYDLSSFFRSFWQKQGTVVAGTWAWNVDANQTNFASVTGETAGVYQNTSAGNLDEYKWSDIFLVPGTYKITILTRTGVNRAIIEVLFGTRSLGTIDTYSADTVFNVVQTITFTLTAAQTADLRFRCNGKNEASTNHVVTFSRFELEKTA